MRYVYYVTALLVVLTISIAGFRGRRSTQPPIEVFPDMNRQAKYKPQAESKFFADGRADRPLPAGVVPRGRVPASGRIVTFCSVTPSTVTCSCRTRISGEAPTTWKSPPCPSAPLKL